MAVCTITAITYPTSSTSVTQGSTITITWSRTGLCNNWNVTDVKLQSNYSGSWTNVADLWNSSDPVNSNSLNVTLPSSVTNPGDYYRLKVEYELGGFEP